MTPAGIVLLCYSIPAWANIILLMIVLGSFGGLGIGLRRVKIAFSLNINVPLQINSDILKYIRSEKG